MSVRNLVLISVLLPVMTVTSASGLQSPEQLGHEPILLDEKLRSGLSVDGAVYRKERLGGKALLQVRRQSGLSISARDGSSRPSLSEAEFEDLVSRLLVRTHQEHQDQLDSIQVELALVDSLWSGAVTHLREATIPPDYRVTPKSDHVLHAMQTYLAESAPVRRVCGQVSALGKKCKKHAVSMNPIPFQSPYVGKQWGEVRALPDAGMLKDGVWFAIDLEDL